MAVALTVAEVVGEQVELGVEDGFVIDARVETSNLAGDVDALQPVDPHGVEDFVDGFSFGKGTVKSGDNGVLLVGEVLDFVVIVPLHTSLDIIKLVSDVGGKSVIESGVDCFCGISIWSIDHIFGIRVGVETNDIGEVLPSGGHSVVLSIRNISRLLLEEAELQLEGRGNLHKVVSINLEQTVKSSLENLADVCLSVFVGICNFCLNQIDFTPNWLVFLCWCFIQVIDVPSLIINGLDGVITEDVEVDGSVGGGTLLVHGHSIRTGLGQVAEGLAVGVTVKIATANAVSASEGALDRSVRESLVGGHLGESHGCKRESARFHHFQ